MATYFVPYSRKSPAPLFVNGHRLIILAQAKEDLEANLDLLGADRVRKVMTGDDQDQHELALTSLARTAKASIVVAPVETKVSDIIRELETQLPWMQ